MIPLLAALGISEVLGLSRDATLWLAGGGFIAGLVVMGWIAWRGMVAIGGTSTRRSERLARKHRS